MNSIADMVGKSGMLMLLMGSGIVKGGMPGWAFRYPKREWTNNPENTSVDAHIIVVRLKAIFGFFVSPSILE